MSLLDDAREAQSRRGPICHVRIAIENAVEPLSSEIAEAVADTVEATALRRVLRNHGISLSDRSINRHRAGDCLCP